jgi:hypothetical protein
VTIYKPDFGQLQRRNGSGAKKKEPAIHLYHGGIGQNAYATGLLLNFAQPVRAVMVTAK